MEGRLVFLVNFWLHFFHLNIIILLFINKIFIIKTATSEYAFFAHFKQHSIVVKQGQKLRTGELLGLCGNSGNSSEPHLHFHLQNVEDMVIATGAKCYFDQLKVNGVLKSDYSKNQIKVLQRNVVAC